MKKCLKLSEEQTNQLNKVVHNSKRSGREVRKAQAVLMLNQEIKITIIKQATLYGRRQIYELREKYLKQGLKIIEDKQKGKPKKLLTQSQLKEIDRTLKTKTPEDFNYSCSFWTTSILGDHIKREYDVCYKSKTSLYVIFKEAKFTFHKPGRVYEKQNPQEVAKWQKETKPKIEKAIKEKDTIILAEDEMILSTQTTFQKIWLPEEEYPRIEISNTRKNRSVYGFLNIKTGDEHAFKTERQNMYITTDILKEIRKIYLKQKLLILWDGAGWHRGSEVQKFIEKDSNIEIIYFPRYTPEENPQEHVWKSGRDQVTHNRFIENIDTATDEFIEYLNKTNFPYSVLGFSAIS